MTRQDTVYNLMRQIHRQCPGGSEFTVRSLSFSAAHQTRRKGRNIESYHFCVPQTQLENAVVGCVIMTKYNDKSYRIDEIDFSETPNSTFSMRRNGVTTNVRYAAYIEEVSEEDYLPPAVVEGTFCPAPVPISLDVYITLLSSSLHLIRCVHIAALRTPLFRSGPTDVDFEK